MRGVSACIVVLLHVFGAGYITGSNFISRGYVFVDFFFVLSGFVIAASYGQRLADGFPIRTFALLRLGRLYPLHLFMLLVFLLLIGLREVAILPADAMAWSLASNGADQFLRALLLVESFAPEVSGWNGPSWTIEVEFWTYIVAALAFALCKTRAWLFFAATAGGAGALMALYYFGVRVQPFGIDPFNMLRCLYAFALGVLAWESSQGLGIPIALPRGRDYPGGGFSNRDDRAGQPDAPAAASNRIAGVLHRLPARAGA